MFGMDFYRALGPLHKDYSTDIYGTYLAQAGFSPDIIQQKCAVFAMYADADASPEVTPNYGDNDPHWSRAFTKLSQLIEHHPSAILFDSGTVDPTVDPTANSGNLEGKRDVTIPMDSKVLEKAVNDGGQAHSAAVVMNTEVP